MRKTDALSTDKNRQRRFENEEFERLKVNKLRNSALLVLTAFIWGVAFVAQSTGGDAVGPYTFNSIRFLIGGIVLLPVIAFLKRREPLKDTSSEEKTSGEEEKKILIIGGISCGVVLFVASTLQQVGIYMGAETGKAGFLTACYIILVPILGVFLKKKCGWNIWIGVIITLAGLYLLCINGSFRLGKSDILLLLCALAFSVQILLVDHFSPLVNGVQLACIEFLVSGVLGLVPMFFVDMGHSLEGIRAWAPAMTTGSAWIAILYAGVLSSGVAYTLQIVGQKGLNPTVASLLMSLESVFSVLAGWVILHEVLSKKELAGCALIFVAVVLAQIPVKTIGKNRAK